MKNILRRILALLMVLSLTACGKQADVSVAPEEPIAEEPTAEFLCGTREAGRLYAFPVDGSAPKLLLDEYCNSYQRMGNNLVAVFADGTVRRIELKTGKDETLFTFGDTIPDRIGQYSGGFLYINFSMDEGSSIYKYDYASKKSQPLFDDPNCWDYVIIDDVMYYNTYGGDDWVCQLVAYDLNKNVEVWRVDTQNGGGLVTRDDILYISEGDGTPRWFTVNLADGSRTTTDDIPASVSAYDVRMLGSGGALVDVYEESGSQENCGIWQPYFITEQSENRLKLPLADGLFPIVQDHEGDLALLELSGEEVSYTIFGEMNWWNPTHWVIFNAADGTFRELTELDETQKMFADGDFPVFDCSTARKPVVQDIYNMFCMDTGVGGASPVCNTTHGAWTAIADRTSDIALLAAPTEEEQAYLKEQGVEVEMKLYGGDGLVFIGNTKAGVTDLTLDQVRAIYCGEITNWSELGGVDHEIRVLYRDDQSGSQRLFENLIWKGEEIPDFEALGFDREDEMSTIVSECLYEPYTIGYSIMTYLNDVYAEEELLCFSLEGVSAKPESIQSGEYPLGTRGYVVIRADEAKDSPARRLFDWIGSSVCDQILTWNSITPLHEN